jgi:hypothetical protein
MPLNLNNTRQCLSDFNFSQLFIEELGWSKPTSRQAATMSCQDKTFTRVQVAQLAGVIVFDVVAHDGQIPDAETRAAVHKEISKLHHENLLIFVDAARTQSLWYWVKRQNGKTFPRDHIYVKGQPGDLFLSKLNSIVFDIGDFDASGNVPLLSVTDRLKEALDVERITKKFYVEFQGQHLAFLDLIEGIDDERDQRWYASVLLNRLMFIYFLQRKFFLDSGDGQYLQNKLGETRKKGRDLYYAKFLKVLFFEGFAKPEDKRDPEANKLLGKIKYLNGGLFLPHPVEERWPTISVPDKAFESLYALFERYSWNLNDTPGGEDNEINPDVLGYIFEKYINQKAFGAYYTRTEITEYLCDRTIHRLILDGVNTPGIPGVLPPRHFHNVGELLLNLDVSICRKLLLEVLPNLRLLDPACGSAAFLVAAMKTLINIYAAVVGRIEFLGDPNLKRWLADIKEKHPSVNYFIKKSIITENLFGVDIMEEAIEIAKLRLFLALVAAANVVDDLEALPNIEFNIMTGNSLIGLMKVDDKDFENRTANLFRKSYRQVLEEKNRLIRSYRDATSYTEDLQALRDRITDFERQAADTLNEILLDEFKHLGIKYEEATWDDKKNIVGKPVKRAVTLADIEALKPFHWGFEFDEIINERGGFDAIITNPPWEIVKPIAKEFCYEYDPEVERRGTDIKDFEKRLAKLLEQPKVREKYLEYLSRFPHVSAFFRSADQYKNQISIVNGKKAGSDINLYKLFTEYCFNLVRNGGYCGMVVPSGIYSDLGAKQLRELLFAQTEITGLFCFENRKEIFEGVHRSYKFLVLTFEKGKKTTSFPAAFMRHDVAELEQFPHEGTVAVPVDLIRRLSPDSLSVMEFKDPLDVIIAEKMLCFPLLAEEIPDRWNLHLTREFDMTNDSGLFQTKPRKNCLPLYEGKMIWHYEHGRSEFRYWISEQDGKEQLLSSRIRGIRAMLRQSGVPENVVEDDVLLGYTRYRLGIRAVTGATNERALVVSVIPKMVFAGNSILVSVPVRDELHGKNWIQTENYNSPRLLFACAVLSGYVPDWFIRQKILTNMNMFFIYEIPVPRLVEKDAAFWPIVKRAARLICTTDEFDDLAKEVGLKNHKDGVTDLDERASLRAELDGLIAHIYGLTEEEFAYILTTFPLVEQPAKDAALAAYWHFAPKPLDKQIAALLAAGESATVEFDPPPAAGPSGESR